jgi:hypothetical protein
MGGGEDSGSDEDCSALLGLDQLRPRSPEKVTAPPAAADDVVVAAEGPPLRAQTTSVALSRLKEQTLGIVRDADWLRHELERETGEQLAMWTSRRQRLEEIVTEMVSLQHAYLQSTQEAGEAEVAGGALPLVELRTGCEASIRSMQELFAEEAEAGSADSREAAAAAALLAAAPSAHQPWLAEQRRIRLQNASRRRAAMARASLQPQQPQPQQKLQQQKQQQPPQQKQAGGQAAASAAEVGKLQRALRHSQSEVARLRQELEQALTQDLAQLGAARRALDSSASDRKRVTAATLERVRKQLRSSTAALEHERVAHAASQRLVRETRGQLAVAQAALRDHVTSAAAIAAQTAAAAEQHGGGAAEQQQQLQLLRSQLAHSQQRCAGLERKLAKQATRRTRLTEGADQRVSGAGAAEQQQQQQQEVEDGDEEEGGVEGGYHVLGGDDAALRIELETLRERERVGGQRRASLEAEVNRLELELE